jgi:hypothetical protein
VETIALSDLSPAVGFLDPHGGGTELKRVRSRAAIVIVRSDALGRVFVMHTWADRVSTDVLMTLVLDVAERHGVKTFGVEANGLQSLFAGAILRDAKLRSRQLPLVPVYQPTHRTKTNRIRDTLQPLLGAGRLFLQPGMHELRHEIATFPMNPRADLVDALASACHLLPPARARSEYDAAHEAKLRYLRATGASPAALQEADRARRTA